MKNGKTGRNLAGVIVMVLILAAIIAVTNPDLLFFLGDSQRAALSDFNAGWLGQLPLAFGSINITASSLLSLAVLVVCLFLTYRIIAGLLSLFTFKNKRAETLKLVTVNALRYVAVLAGIIWGLIILGVNVTAIFAGVGIIALVISLGAQSLFADIFTGIFVIFEGQYQVGDVISIDGFRGTVISLGIRTTRLMDVGGNIKIINNSDIHNVLNLSERTSVAVCNISIAYGASIEKAEAVIAETANAMTELYPEVFKIAPEYVGVQDLSSSSVDLRVVAKVDEAEIYRARRLLNRELKLAFDRNGVEIPFPQLDIHQR